MHDTLRFQTSLFPNPGTPASSRRSRNVLWLATAFVFFFTSALAYAKDYTRIVVFGDSLSDTGNVNFLFDPAGVSIPGQSVDYTHGRFTDGFDTIPHATNYIGVWVEQLAAAIPSRPQVQNSLEGGTNYAYGFATTGFDTGFFAPMDDVPTFGVPVDNIGLQIANYLNTHPKINNSTLFVIWGGANDLIHAASAADPNAVITAAVLQETADIKALIDAGATQFLVLNLPPLGLTPRMNGDPAKATAGNVAAQGFNAGLAAGIAYLQSVYGDSHIRFFQVDVYSLFNRIAASPADFGLTNFTAPSRGNFEVNPDTYLFWDDIHPTTRGHAILAAEALKAIGSPQCDSWGMPSCAAAVQ